MSSSKTIAVTPKPLDIRCTSADCENGLHCFRQSRRLKAAGPAGRCRYCGADLIDWSRVQRRNFSDVSYTFASLRREFIRHYFWHVVIDQRALNYARRKGMRLLEAAARLRLEKKIGVAVPAFDGRQTPMAGSGNPLTYAQHAVAACCRKCVEYWHGIPMGRALTKAELDYLSQLVVLFLHERLPDVAENPTHVPPIRGTGF